MPRPLKPINPYGSWSLLFGATLRQLRLGLQKDPSMTQADLGRLIAYSGATVSAVERGELRPDDKFIEACERELGGGGVLRALLPFVATEWEEGRHDNATKPGTSLQPSDMVDDRTSLLHPAFLASLSGSAAEAKALALHADSSDVGDGMVETLQLQVDRYCRDYPTVSPMLLEPRVRRRLRELREILDGRLTLRQRRDVLTVGGFLTLLLACLDFDMGDREAAEEARDAAFQLGRAAEHQEIVAWTFELSAWFALVDKRYEDTVTHSQTGLLIAPNTSAGVQLAVQEAKGWSRMGKEEEAERALQAGALSLTRLPVPAHPEHHFVFDAPKLSFYAGTCWAWLGQVERAREHANAVVAQCLSIPGQERWPVRLAESRVDLGLVAVQRGELEVACHLGELALGSQRRSGSTLGRVHELDAAVLESFPDASETRQFHERYVASERALRFGGTP
jgi:helix-turn-helix protein